MDTPPFRVQHKPCRCDEIPKEVLFEWIRDDQEPGTGQTFEIPQYFEAHVPLDYLEVLHSRGSDAAFRWAVLFAIGEEGWRAMRSPGMTDETFDAIGKVILDRVRGRGSGPKES